MAKDKDSIFPLPSWQEWYEEIEQLWTGPLHALLGSDGFNGLMAIQREFAFSQQQMLDRILDKQWELLRLPARREHARLAGQVVDLGQKMEALEDQLASVEQLIREQLRPRTAAAGAQA